MKQPPHLEKAQQAMQPGVITLRGFLGKDDRNLIDILTADDATVSRLGHTHGQIVDRMDYFREKGASGQGFFIEVPPHFDVLVQSVRGGIPCPYGCAGLLPKTNITVKSLRKRKTVIYTDLSMHLIREHGFYQGAGAPFRLNPVELVDILEV